MKLNLPLKKEDIAKLQDGEIVYLSGKMLTARDAAHKRIKAELLLGESKVNLEGQTIYYAGGCKDDNKFLSLGPTTSKRMDAYVDLMLDNGVVAFVGKGKRSDEVMQSLNKKGGAYFVAVGGAGAYYAKCIKSYQRIAYADLGCEAVYELDVVDFPVVYCKN